MGKFRQVLLAGIVMSFTNAGVSLASGGSGGAGDMPSASAPAYDPAAEYMKGVAALNARMVQRAIAAGGTATGEHGVGLGKRAYLEAEHGASGLAAMRRLKAAFDPHFLLNPGKILP